MKIYNDNNATTPQATIAGLEALDDEKRNIVLIAGGADKNIDVLPLAEAIESHCKAVFFLPGSGTERITPLLQDSSAKIFVVTDLKEALSAARNNATEGDILLFSPAFASFGLFTNEYDRNDQFVALVHERDAHEAV